MSDNLSPEAVQRRQWMVAGGLALLAAGAVVLYFWFSRPAAPPPPEDRIRKTLASTGKLDERGVWRAQAEADLGTVQKDVKQQEGKLKQMEEENAVLKKQLTDFLKSGGGRASAPVITAPPPAPVPSYAKETEAAPARGLPPAPPSRIQAMSTPQDKQGFQARAGGTGQPGGALAHPMGSPVSSSGIVTLTWAAPVPKPDNASAPQGKSKSYIPQGSFVQADLLIGLDAPTGGQAQKNPQPVLLRLVDNAILPSRMRAQVRECFVTGAAYGDQSAERAYIRTEGISCVGPNGQAFDVKFSGTVAGEDGKVGLRGRLVHKQGAILQQALVASVASGIGQAFRSSSSTQSVSALGSTATVNAGEEFKAGFASGLSNAADRLANYWISLAEKLHPVVEVDAGRRVTVMFTSGLAMELPATHALEVEE